MIRLDKYLSETGTCTRSEAKQYVKKGLVRVDGTVAKSSDLKIDETTAIVTVGSEQIVYRAFEYIMLNKPQGVITATQDRKLETVMELLGDGHRKDLSPVGRLDRDTTGLLLITNDGALSHNLLAPGKHVFKTYLVTCEKAVLEDDLIQLREGVDIGDSSPTLPCLAESLGENKIELRIREGRYHQVKRMLEAVDNRVIALHRTAFGSLQLDAALEPGEWRYLTNEEIMSLKS